MHIVSRKKNSLRVVQLFEVYRNVTGYHQGHFVTFQLRVSCQYMCRTLVCRRKCFLYKMFRRKLLAQISPMVLATPTQYVALSRRHMLLHTLRAHCIFSCTRSMKYPIFQTLYFVLHHAHVLNNVVLTTVH